MTAATPLREANQQRVDAAAQRVRKSLDKYPADDTFRKDVELLIEIALAPVLEIFAAAQNAFYAGALAIMERQRAVAMNSEAPQKLPAAAQPQRESEPMKEFKFRGKIVSRTENFVSIESAQSLQHTFRVEELIGESDQPEQALREIIANMPHNGAVMFSSNKNELGHDQSCYKCKLEAALSPQTDSLSTQQGGPQHG